MACMHVKGVRWAARGGRAAATRKVGASEYGTGCRWGYLASAGGARLQQPAWVNGQCARPDNIRRSREVQRLCRAALCCAVASARVRVGAALAGWLGAWESQQWRLG